MSHARYIAMVPEVIPETPCSGCNGELRRGDSCTRCVSGNITPVNETGQFVPEGGWQPQLWKTPGEARRSLWFEGRRAHPSAYVVAVPLDDLERVDPPESDDEREQRLERVALAAWAEVDRLRLKRCAPPVERDPLKAPVTHLRAVVTNHELTVSARIGDAWVDQIHINGRGMVSSFAEVPITAAKPRSGT